MAKKALNLEWDENKQYKFFSREIMIPFIACLLMAFGPMINTQLSGLATPYLMADIGAAKYLSLQTIINSVFRACAALAWGGIFERYNQKSIILILSLFQMAAALLYTVVGNVPILILGTLLGAIGSGGATAGLITIIGYLLPTQYRATFHSVRSLIFVGVTTLTPLASWLITTVTWRAIYAFNLICYTLAFLAVVIFVPSMPINKDKVIVKKKYDFIGMIIFLIGTIVIFLSTYLGGSVLPWTSPLLYVLIVGGLFIYYLGIRYEKTLGDDALVNIRLLKNKNFMSVVFMACMFYAAFNVKTYQQMLSVQGLGLSLTIYTAAKVIPAMFGNGIGVVYPLLMQKTGWYRQITIFMIVLNVVAMILWGTLRVATFTTIFIYSIASSCAPQSLGQLLVVNSIGKEDMSKAGGTYTFMSFFTTSIFSLLYNILYNNVHVAKLRPMATAAGILDKLTPAQIETMSTYTVLSSAKSLSVFKETFGANTELYNKAVSVIKECVISASQAVFFLAAILTATAIFGVSGISKDIKIPAPKSKAAAK